MTRAFLLFGFAMLVGVAGVGYLLTLGFSGPGDAAAIRLSAIVAVVVQLAAFAVVMLMAPARVMAGWGAGALLRLATIGVYAALVTKVLALPVTAALVSMAAFFFLTTLFEPFFLRTIR